MPELAKTYDPKLVEDKWYRYWEENDFFRTEPNPAKQPYVIMMPPPNVTGILHMGHALQDSIQDALIRYHRMQGREALWMPGMDHAGIATQNVVEKELADQGANKEELGREAFLEKVWEWKEKHGGIISIQKRRLGDSPDWHRERFTMDEGMSRAVAEAFVQLYNEGLIYRGDYIVNWCPRCRTAISDEEVDHKDTEGNLWYIRYPLKDSDEFLAVATTRPETMLGDTAVAANPRDKRFKHLKGKTVLLPVLGREIPVIFDSFVDPEFGTGLVKVTPAHDPNDFDMGQRHDLERVKVLDDQGIMTAEAGSDFKGMDRFECRKALVKRLEDHGLIEKIETHKHSVGHCQRCKTMIEPYLSRQWFVKMKPLAEPGIEAAKSGRVKFVPKRWEKVYLSWLENIRDWCISRQLWWGHRIPVYRCDDCSHEWATANMPEKCPECGCKSIQQDPDVLDTWFSSWLWPFSTLGWPEKNDSLKYFYPTDVLVSGYDIIFFWIARMIMAGIKFTGEEPYHTVYITGMIKDELGRWMSKSLGNGIDPLEMIEQYGTDAVRYSLVVLTTEGQDIRLAPSRFEMGRNFANKLWNAARFLLMQEKPEHFTVTSPEELEDDDLWIQSRLQNMLRTVEKKVKRYRLNEALLAIYDFTWHDYCDWYVERIKPRLYQTDEPVKREGTLAFALKIFETALRALHPFMPFITEEIWQHIAQIKGLGINTMKPATIMLQEYPKFDKRLINHDIERKFESLKKRTQPTRNVRSEYNIPPKAPIPISVTGSTEDVNFMIDNVDFFETMATGSTEINYTPKKPKNTITRVVDGLEIHHHCGEYVDIVKEREKLDKKIGQLKKMLIGVERKLVNPSFLKKAPNEVIIREKKKKTDIEHTLMLLKRNRDELD